MESTDLTARQLYQQHRVERHLEFGIGDTVALVNVDLQRAYTGVDEFPTADETDPRQLDHVNEVAAVVRRLGAPVVWTYVAYEPSGEDCGAWGTSTDTPDSLQNITVGSRRAQLDERLDVSPGDLVLRKRMASAFFETNLASATASSSPRSAWPTATKRRTRQPLRPAGEVRRRHAGRRRPGRAALAAQRTNTLTAARSADPCRGTRCCPPARRPRARAAG